MARSVEIDGNSGFCAGVIRAIRKAESFLDGQGEAPLYSIGAIVHNEEELARLQARGLVTIDREKLESVADTSAGDRAVLIRAHGEPPSTYETARGLGLRVIDCTCPVVLKLQQDIKEAHMRLQRQQPEGRLLIFGKPGHAEVLGLVGQTEGKARVVEDSTMLREAVSDLPEGARVELFSQTTKAPDEYEQLYSELSALIGKERITIHNTICLQVASRHERLVEFAGSHDVILFVAGRDSSNGKVLFDLCRSVNPRTYRIGSSREVDSGWFRPDDRVGVCGATSTPKWLLEEVAARASETSAQAAP